MFGAGGRKSGRYVWCTLSASEELMFDEKAYNYNRDN